MQFTPKCAIGMLHCKLNVRRRFFYRNVFLSVKRVFVKVFFKTTACDVRH